MEFNLTRSEISIEFRIGFKLLEFLLFLRDSSPAATDRIRSTIYNIPSNEWLGVKLSRRFQQNSSPESARQQSAVSSHIYTII